MKKIKELIKFVQDVAADSRIPEKDKKILLVLIALILSPFDIIPDWIPIIGILDDIIILSVVLDYFFNQLDQDLLLSHYPWGMKSYIRVRRISRWITVLTPTWLTNKIWSYKPSIYNN